MSFVTKGILNPNVSRNKYERLIRDKQFYNLLLFIKEKKPILREIQANFKELDNKKLIEYIELGVKFNLIRRENRRYFFNVLEINELLFGEQQKMFSNVSSSIKEHLLKISNKYNIQKEILLPYYMQIIFDVYTKQHKINEDLFYVPTTINNVKQFTNYKVGQYLFCAITDLNEQRNNWFDYFIHNNEEKYQNLRNLLGDVHPDYFLDHVLKLYKKVKRRGTIKYTDDNLYLDAAILMNQIINKNNICTLNIPLYVKADIKFIDNELLFTISNEITEILGNIKLDSYIKYLAISTNILSNEDYHQFVIYNYFDI